MPIIVTVHLLSAESHDLKLPGGATVRDVKVALARHLGVNKSWLQLYTTTGSPCAKNTGLLELMGHPLADVLDPKTLKNMWLELALYTVVTNNQCRVCGANEARRCAGCEQARYCSRECQQVDWPSHRKVCRTGIEGSAK